MSNGKVQTSCTQSRSTSNLVNDLELTMKFQEVASQIAGSLYYKFYQVYEEMDVEDVVSECWQKILRQNISYDESKGANFRTFTRMIVTQRLIELTRERNRIDRIPYLVSLDQELEKSETSSQVSTRADLIPDERAEQSFTYSELQDELNEFSYLLNGVPGIDVERVFNLYAEGYRIDEIVQMTGYDKGYINCIRRVIKEIRKNRSNGTAKSLADIMYGESQEWDLS